MMINTPITAFGDLHLRAKSPEMRIDNYIKTQEHKIRWAFREVPKNSLVVFPGDVFDSSTEPYWLIEMLMNILNERKDLYYVFVPGQHDQRYHKLDLHNTPLSLLIAGVRNGTLLSSAGLSIRGFLLFGRAYGDSIPKPLPESKETQILVAHKMLVKDEDLYPGQNAILTNSFMRIYPYDIIISGDNHQRFIERLGSRVLVNMGSFMRMKTDQKKHKPAICVITGNHTNIKEIPISPSKEVFAKKSKSVKKLVQTIGKDFIHGIKEDEKKDVTFIDRLNKKLRKEDSEVRSVINDCLSQVEEQCETCMR